MSDFNFPSENEEYITTAILENPTRNPIHIISGEYSELNKRILYPRQRMQINLKIPAGQTEFIKEAFICGKQTLYIGTMNSEASDPFVFNPDN